ncbi:hypothetical protein B0H66DRAFT_534757 [Apodospora peruviana]|uniref:Uncharacterized protein n=1 Tax=Apodospora peruviana TaxID=516989 RepID=A0AAE0I0W1_9PEZI|nr:hypothetical protein B0H66DRAFT_534757 [Apodospora peruviana]
MGKEDDTYGRYDAGSPTRDAARHKAAGSNYFSSRICPPPAPPLPPAAATSSTTVPYSHDTYARPRRRYGGDSPSCSTAARPLFPSDDSPPRGHSSIRESKRPLARSDNSPLRSSSTEYRRQMAEIEAIRQMEEMEHERRMRQLQDARSSLSTCRDSDLRADGDTRRGRSPIYRSDSSRLRSLSLRQRSPSPSAEHRRRIREIWSAPLDSSTSRYPSLRGGDATFSTTADRSASPETRKRRARIAELEGKEFEAKLSYPATRDRSLSLFSGNTYRLENLRLSEPDRDTTRGRSSYLLSSTTTTITDRALSAQRRRAELAELDAERSAREAEHLAREAEVAMADTSVLSSLPTIFRSLSLETQDAKIAEAKAKVKIEEEKYRYKTSRRHRPASRSRSPVSTSRKRGKSHKRSKSYKKSTSPSSPKYRSSPTRSRGRFPDNSRRDSRFSRSPVPFPEDDALVKYYPSNSRSPSPD